MASMARFTISIFEWQKSEQNEFEPNNTVLISKVMQMNAPKQAQVLFFPLSFPAATQMHF